MLERTSTTRDTHNQKKFSFLTQRLPEPTLLSTLKLSQRRKELTKLLPLKLERISTTRDTHNQKRFSSSTQKLLEPTPPSTLKVIQTQQMLKKINFQ